MSCSFLLLRSSIQWNLLTEERLFQLTDPDESICQSMEINVGKLSLWLLWWEVMVYSPGGRTRGGDNLRRPALSDIRLPAEPAS